jgi:hypothetical protein
MKRIDIGSELGEVRSATEGARVLADLLAFDGAPDSETARLLPRRISATLSLIVERLRLVERALNGGINPAVVHAQHSSAVGEGGTHLSEWSQRRLRQNVERELRRLNHEAGRGRGRRRS